MSRIGKQPVILPAGVKVRLEDGTIFVEGPKGKLQFTHHRNIAVGLDDAKKALIVTRPDDERNNRALHGLTRSIIANMVEGVTKGYERRLKIEGIGYQARMEKKSGVLTGGYRNTVPETRRDGGAGAGLAEESSELADVKKGLPYGGNVKAAKVVGAKIAEAAKAKGIAKVAFDRGHYRYHGRVKALADAARESGLQF